MQQFISMAFGIAFCNIITYRGHLQFVDSVVTYKCT